MFDFHVEIYLYRFIGRLNLDCWIAAQKEEEWNDQQIHRFHFVTARSIGLRISLPYVLTTAYRWRLLLYPLLKNVLDRTRGLQAFEHLRHVVFYAEIQNDRPVALHIGISTHKFHL